MNAQEVEVLAMVQSLTELARPGASDPEGLRATDATSVVRDLPDPDTRPVPTRPHDLDAEAPAGSSGAVTCRDSHRDPADEPDRSAPGTTWRHTLELTMIELRQWADLLRHKALALRAVSDAAQQRGPGAIRTEPFPLSPGSLDPEALAEVLSRVPPPRRATSSSRPQLRVVPDATQDLLSPARTLWDSVADPEDRMACQELAGAADRLADRLEEHWRDTRDAWRAAGWDARRPGR